eukprot:TRINITY_DN91632_c0_g1_i1.p1 TRINITY_DN91632_c0_g1~~TRINITY_DN91632_c0_g1_i1.p1  ORF type:complete len:174 (+),score=30.95 TRINITY_DN91632_c0_g1_i1:39-560(+)
MAATTLFRRRFFLCLEVLLLPCCTTRLAWPECAEDASCLFNSTELALLGTGGDGGNSGAVLLVSVVSYVFNVTSAPQYYRPNLGSYAALTGRDASRSLATMSMEDEDVKSQILSDLEGEQWEELFNWIDKYQEKYTLIGRLLDWKPNVSFEDINKWSGFSLKPPQTRADRDEL